MAADPAFLIRPTNVNVAVTSTSLQGTTSSKITDLWVYVNGKFQGAYPTGNLIPVISNNEQVRINIFAGIKNNGISNTRLSWVFYDYITIDTLVENHLTINRPLTFRYNPNVKFEWLENFDGNGVSLIKATESYAVSDTTWKPAQAQDCFEGKSAEIGLYNKSIGTFAKVESSIDHPMPLSSTNVYLELNYKSNEVFEVGVSCDNTDKAALYVNPSENWNKIYISLADVVNRQPNASAQRVYFKLVRTSNTDNPKMFLDNIKLVYFQ